MFIVELFQSGGCDSTISCGTMVVPLPKTIKNMEEAFQYVTDENFDDPEDGQISFYGDAVNSATIYEVVNTHEIDVAAVRKEQEEKREAAEEIRQQQNELAEFERLKKKLGK